MCIKRTGLSCGRYKGSKHISVSIPGLKFSLCPLFQAVEGPGLAFIVYSEAIKDMPLPQLWSVLYFSMLLLLGMGSMLGNITAIITPLRDFKVLSSMSIELLNGEIQIRW